MSRLNTTKEPDSIYFLKILLYFVLGTIWVVVRGNKVIPLGLILGLIFSHQDHFSIDRKVEYAVLLVASLLALSGLVGLNLSVR